MLRSTADVTLRVQIVGTQPTLSAALAPCSLTFGFGTFTAWANTASPSQRRILLAKDTRGSVRGSWWTAPSVRATRSLTRCVTSRTAATVSNTDDLRPRTKRRAHHPSHGIEFLAPPAPG